MFAVETEPYLAVNRRSLPDFLPVDEPVFTASTASATSATFTVWLYLGDDAPACAFADPRNGTIIDNKPLVGIYEPHRLPDAKACLDYLREECRKAGFAGCWVIAQHRDNNAGQLADLSKWGFDSVYAYCWGTANAQGQQGNLQAHRSHKSIDILPTLSMGWDLRGWYGGRGYWLAADEFKGLLQWARDTYMPAGPEGALSRRVVMLDNWNEWGEGHCMMPAAKWGFGYVNAAREILGKGPFPPNVIPTPAQLARLDTLYPSSDWGAEERSLTSNSQGKFKREPGLAARWKLDDIEGETAPDCSGNGQDGTLINGPRTVVDEKGGALRFNGIFHFVSNKDKIFPDISDTFTMALWAKPDETRAVVTESNQGDSGTSGQRYAIFPAHGNVYGEGHAGAGISIGTNGISVYEHADGYMPALLVHNAALAGWNHVAVVYEKKQPKLYLNGVLVKTGLTSAKIAHPGQHLGENGVSYGYFQGLLRDVRIYDRALTAAEIEKLAGDKAGK